MRGVAELLTGSRWDEALVRLCHLAGHVNLNKWESHRRVNRAGDPAFEAQVERFRRILDRGATFDEAEVEAAPLALIRALDVMLVDERRARRFCRVPFTIGEQSYWLVPRKCTFENVPSLRFQPGSLARWMPHHALFHCMLLGAEN